MDENSKFIGNLPQLVRAALDSFPAPHDVQEEDPEEELYVPAAHDVQEEAPEDELNFPTAHLAQEDMLELLYSPAGHFTERYGNKSIQCEFQMINELILGISSLFKIK